MQIAYFLLTTGTTAPPSDTGGGLDENVIQLVFVLLIAIGIALAFAARGATAVASPSQRSLSTGVIFFLGLVVGVGLVLSQSFVSSAGTAAQHAEAGGGPPQGPGRQLFASKPCTPCHTIDGLSTG